MALSPAARALLESDAVAHLVTLNADGSPSVAIVWVGLDGDEIIAGHLSPAQHKLKNIRRDPRVSLSVESPEVDDHGMRRYLVVRGRARLTEGGAPELLQRLAHVYVGPDVRFPPMDNPPPGFISHITIERIGGNGDWEA